MPRVDYSRGAGTRVRGLYVALRERDRESRERHGRFVASMIEQHGFFPWTGSGSRRRFDGLHAGKPVVLMGRELSGHGIPDVPLSREQWSDWFTVTPDDTVLPAEDPDAAG
jgi:hypothetical protein